jgi:nucleotidyltransferase AbiEii toxin of type IV toxin-antitoxin system
VNKPRQPPRTVQVLNKWVDAYARQHETTPGRMRNWVSYMILGGALERAGFAGAGPKFTIKGGVALELRLRSVARATKDLDLIFNSPTGELVEELETALEPPYEGFTFRRKGEPNRMPNGAVRVEIALQYSGRPWDTVRIDIARYEADGTAVEMVDAISLAPFGLRGPESLPCLALPDQVAQKIHAMTLPPPEDRRNERFQDLVDLLCLRELISDYGAVQTACKKIFAYRTTHPWPPFFEPPKHWEGPFERMATEVGLPITDIYQAAFEIRHFIHSIDESAPLFAEIELTERITATTWYFALGSDFRVHRIPVSVAEALVLDKGVEQLSIPPEWQHHEGGVALIGAVIILQDRKPVFVERSGIAPCALNDAVAEATVEITHRVWVMLAEEIIRFAKAPERAVDALAVFLSYKQGNLPCEIAAHVGITPREAHKYFLGKYRPQKARLTWDLWTSKPVKWIYPTDLG